MMLFFEERRRREFQLETFCSQLDGEQRSCFLVAVGDFWKHGQLGKREDIETEEKKIMVHPDAHVGIVDVVGGG